MEILKKMNRKTPGLLVAAVVFIALVIVSSDLKSADKPMAYTIGAIVFLTGPQAPLGTEVKNALTVGQDEINEKGGIRGRKLEILYEDSKDSPRDAIMAFNRLETEEVPVIISTGDVVSLNLAPIVDEIKIPMVATVAAGPDITKKSNWVFRVFIQATRQAETMAQYASKSLGLKSVAILAINNEFGVTTSQTFTKIFKSLGGIITGLETFGIMDREVRTQITKLKATRPQAIYVTGFGEGYGAAIKQVRELKFAGLILTDATLSISYFQQQTMPASEGAYFTGTLYDENSRAPLTVNFIKRYKEKFGSKPGFIGAFAYDALRLIATAIEKGGYTPQGIKDALLSIKNYPGVVGKISFTSGGDLDFPLVVKKMIKSRAIIVSGGEYGRKIK